MFVCKRFVFYLLFQLRCLEISNIFYILKWRVFINYLKCYLVLLLETRKYFPQRIIKLNIVKINIKMFFPMEIHFCKYYYYGYCLTENLLRLILYNKNCMTSRRKLGTINKAYICKLISLTVKKLDIYSMKCYK